MVIFQMHVIQLFLDQIQSVTPLLGVTFTVLPYGHVEFSINITNTKIIRRHNLQYDNIIFAITYQSKTIRFLCALPHCI